MSSSKLGFRFQRIHEYAKAAFLQLVVIVHFALYLACHPFE